MKVNKKILGSLAIVAVTSALAIGGTISYFSDKETSELNTFTAGAVDLTVDSVGHYNGLICVDNKWQTCDNPDTSNNLVNNGSFENPEVTNGAKWDIFPGSVTGWTVEWVGDTTVWQGHNRPAPALQEYHEGVLGDAHDGDQYTELDSDWLGPSNPISAPSLVQISQALATEVGKTYQLSYAWAARPNTDAGNNGMKVYVDGDLAATNGGEGGASIIWQETTYTFTANSTSTKIKFVGGGTDDSYGTFLDDVRVYKMNCTASTEYTQACNSTWGQTDLTTDYKFFNFGDIKPGDYGENTISLHVNSNDAFACMTFNQLDDDENTRIEPEEDVDSTIDTGELSENVYMFAWKDDGDNVWETNEQTFWDAPKKAKDVNDKKFDLAVGTPIVGGETRFVGLAWCAGTMGITDHKITCDGAGMGNETQTDKMQFDVGFYVEQARHNEGFTCNEPVNEPVKDITGELSNY